MTSIRKIDDQNFWVYGWTGSDWVLDSACGSLSTAKNAAARLRRRLAR